MVGNTGELGQRRRVGLGPRGGLGDPAGRGAGDGERLLVDGARDLADAGDGADRRDVAHGAVDGALDLVRHEIAAVGVGADGQRLLFQIAQARGVALAHIGVEGSLVLQIGGGGACARDAEARRAASARLVDAAAWSSSARLMRSSFSVVTTSAAMRRSIWSRRWSLVSLKASKARRKSSKERARSSPAPECWADLVSRGVCLCMQGSFAVAVENAGTAHQFRHGDLGPRLRGDDACGEGRSPSLTYRLVENGDGWPSSSIEQRGSVRRLSFFRGICACG